MLGPEGVTSAVTAMLAANMPAKIIEMRARPTVPLTAAQLPQIKSFRPVKVRKAAAGEYPALWVDCGDMPGATALSKDRFGQWFAFTYKLTVVTLVRSTSELLTTKMQQRTAEAVRECLLQTQQITAITGGDSIRGESNSLRERFSGIESYARDTGTYGGCMTDINVTAQEYVPRKPGGAWGVVGGITVTTKIPI